MGTIQVLSRTINCIKEITISISNHIYIKDHMILRKMHGCTTIMSRRSTQGCQLGYEHVEPSLLSILQIPLSAVKERSNCA